LLHTHDTTHRMIKSLVLTCLVAAVRADADADAYYSLYGYAGVPFGSSTGLDPITQGLDPVTQGVALPYHGYAGYGYPYYGHYLGKRSADADPAVVVAGAVPFGSSTGLDPITQGLDPVTQGVALPYHGYAGYGYPYYGHYLGKRSADADPAVVVAGAVPFGSSTGLDPITQGLDPVTQGYVPYYGYAGYRHYLGKRSADADPAVVVAGAVPFGSSTGLDPITQGLDPVTQGVALPYHGYAAYGYGYPYFGHHYLGKRSADADADAYYAGYPFAYAAHPYAYAGYHGYPYAAYVPFGSSTGLDPITQGLDPVTQGLVY